MKTCFQILASTFVLFIGFEAYAQETGAISILQPAHEITDEQVMESGRYEKRAPKRSLFEARKKEKPRHMSSDGKEAAPESTPSPTPVPEAIKEKNITEQVRDVVVGGSPEEIKNYRKTLDRKDSRRNALELDAGLTWVYHDSKSEYWYRNTTTSTPGGQLGARVWVTPFLGLSLKYLKSFQGTQSESPGSPGETTYTEEWIELGGRFRRYFGTSLMAPSLSTGLDYYQHEKKFPADDDFHSSLRTRGIKLAIDTRLPTSEKYAWLLGLDYLFSPKHLEMENGDNVGSGSAPDVTQVGFHVGGEIQFDRRLKMIWRLRESVAKYSFQGNAEKTNPYTGAAHEDVNVLSNYLFFELGITWGQ